MFPRLIGPPQHYSEKMSHIVSLSHCSSLTLTKLKSYNNTNQVNDYKEEYLPAIHTLWRGITVWARGEGELARKDERIGIFWAQLMHFSGR